MVSPEGCDDHNLVNNDGCSNTCTVEPHFTCTGSPSVCTPICGDGFVNSPEICDDGSNDGIGCATGCTGNGSGYVCSGGSSTTASTCSVKCGDGIVISPEQCDDNGIANYDGCSSTC